MGVGDVVEVGSIVNVSTDVVGGLVLDVGRIGLWMQTVGIIVILWLIFSIVMLIVNRKKRKYLKSIDERLISVEKKLDLLLKKSKKS
jgi:hypothetical protein